MVDKEGNLVTNQEGIKELAKKAYQERLRNRPIKQGLEDIKESKERLAEKLMNVAKNNKTEPWNIHDLNEVLKSLKSNKSRDPNDLANEIFKPEVAGDDLKHAILNLMNCIRLEQIFHKCLEKCNITSIWKQKCPQRIIQSEYIFRYILDKLTYISKVY